MVVLGEPESTYNIKTKQKNKVEKVACSSSLSPTTPYVSKDSTTKKKKFVHPLRNLLLQLTIFTISVEHPHKPGAFPLKVRDGGKKAREHFSHQNPFNLFF